MSDSSKDKNQEQLDQDLVEQHAAEQADNVKLPDEIMKIIESGKFGIVLLLNTDPNLHKEIALKLIEAGNGFIVAQNLNKFKDLSNDIALKLINDGYLDSVGENLDKFQNLDIKVALKLIKTGLLYGWNIAENIAKFQPSDHRMIALKLLKADFSEAFIGNIQAFQGLDKDVAIKLIEAEEGQTVGDNLEKFEGLDKDIALKLIENGKCYISVVSNLYKFKGLDKEVVLKLIKLDRGNWIKNIFLYRDKFEGLDKDVALKFIEVINDENLDKFQGLDKDIALKLIARRGIKSLVRNLCKFEGLDKEVALKLIEAGKGDTVGDNLEKFQGLDHKEIVLKLLEAGKGASIAENLEKFEGLDHKDIALKLIEAGEGDTVGDNLEKFLGLDHKIIALKLIEAEKGYAIGRNIDKFEGLDKDVALKLIEDGKTYSVAQNLYKFQGLDKNVALKLMETSNGFYGRWIVYSSEKFEGLDKDVAIKLIEAGEGQTVTKNLEKFEGLDKEVVLKLIEAGEGQTVAKNLEKFQGLDKDFALTFIEVGWGKFVAQNLDKFEGLDKDVALKLIEDGETYSVAQNLDKFEGLDKDVALKLIEDGKTYSVAQNLNKFQGLDKDFALMFIEVRLGKFVAENLEKFQGVDHKEIALTLIEAGEGDTVGDNLEKFLGLDHKKIALKLIESRQGESVVRNLDKFQGLDHKEIALKLIEAGEGDTVGENLEKFQGLIFYFQERFGKENYKKGRAIINDLLRKNQQLNFSKDDMTLLNNETEISNKALNKLNIYELNLLAKNKPLSEFSLQTEEEAKEIFEILKTSALDGWNDSTINAKFEQGGKIFGYKKSFLFRNNKNFHDAFYAFDRVIELQKASGLSAEVFYNNILQQVAMDSGTYGQNQATSHQKINEITENFKLDFDDVIKEAKEYAEDIPKLAKLLKGITNLKDVFSSWKMLIQYKELTNLLTQREILKDLKEIKDPKLQEYISTLLFHPAVSNKLAVLMFMKDPYLFFGLDSSHTPAEIHNRKKPTNYVDIPHLDLSANELRDALVKGAMDRIQVWQPLEIIYEVPENLDEYKKSTDELHKTTDEILKLPLNEAIIKVLGKRGQVKGILDEIATKKLFSELNQLLKTKKPDEKALLQSIVKGNYKATSELETAIKELLIKYLQDSSKQNLEKAKGKIVRYKVKFNLKSDPDAVIAGNETQCCMPFGDGKNTLYTFNPICSLLTVQKESGEGVFRTIAQSVLTQDKDIGKDISELKKYIETSGELHLDELLPESILHKSSSYIACDSIEVPNNNRTEYYSRLLSYLYIDGLREYFKKYGLSQNLKSEKALVGAQYGFKLSEQGNIRNTFLPESPVAYSDKYTQEIRNFDLTKKPSGFYTKREVRETKVEKQSNPEIKNKRIKYLTYQDTLATAYIEGKAYQHTSLKEGLANMENMLIAKDINNSAKGRANMSLKYVSDEGEMLAYLVAYEGNDGKKEQTENVEQFIYVADLAKMPKAEKGVGMELINEFIQLYKTNYLDKGKFMPIKADAREVSSYKLIVRNLNEIGKSIGVEFELEEGETYQKAGDTMHHVTIRPNRL